MKSKRAVVLRQLLSFAFFILLAACTSAPLEQAPQGTSPESAAESPGKVATPEDAPAEDAPSVDSLAAEPSEPQTSWDDREVFRTGLIEEAQGALDNLQGASIYTIDFSISDDKLRLEGHQSVKYTNREEIPLEEVYFQLFPNAAGGSSEISNVLASGVEVEPIYETDRTAVRVPLPAPLEPGEAIVIELDFTVDVAQEMGGNYGTFGYFNDILVLDEFYPVIPVYDQEGWHYKVPSNGDLTYLDASFYRVQVSALKKLEMVASGVEVSKEAKGKQQIVTFAAGPARDFYLAASDKYKKFSREVGETVVNSYAFPNRKEGAELVLDIAEDALRIFNRRFGTYPYTEMDLVSTPMMALGIEYPGVMGITLEAYDLEGTLYGLPVPSMLESIVVHEIGHQWFYNAVGNNQVGEPWLDEAVVQYVTGLYYLDRYGESGFSNYSDSWYFRWDRVERVEIPIGMPSEAYTPQEYSAIVYGRGPIFMEALVDEMGVSAFDSFMQEYYQLHVWEIGTGENFKQMAEAHCECDLMPLFEEWVYE
jgi:hypothetical protein